MVDFDPQARFAHAPVARLATVAPDGRPHLVPVLFALRDEVVYTAVDAKPKTTQRLRRLANIEGNPLVSMLVDHYAEDWTQLWWVRIDGIAAVHHDGNAMQAGRDLLRAKYPQYQSVSLNGPVIAVAVRRWDEAAKDPVSDGPDFDHFRPLLHSLLRRHLLPVRRSGWVAQPVHPHYPDRHGHGGGRGDADRRLRDGLTP